MTNLEKWFTYTDGLPTPDSMVQWAWISLIASSLQRRVWLDSDDTPVFANNYIFLVSPPGIGKTLIIDKAEEFLKYWKKGDNSKLIDALFTNSANKLVAEAVVDADNNIENKKHSEEEEIEKSYLFPVAADATTYEALVVNFGSKKCYRRINYVKYDKEGKEQIGIMGYAALAFLLKELGSLLKKRTDDTVTFLLGIYDCPLDYEYDTLSRQKDRIRRGCLNILGATNPSFMNKIFSENLIDAAFLSRSIFVFASKNRKPVSKIPPLSDEQKQFGNDIKKHLLKLSVLYGGAKTTPETDKWIHEWFVDHESHPENRSVQNPKMLYYYSRKLLHMKKVAMSLHFGESTDMLIPLETFQRAIKILDKEEKSMHLALVLDPKNTSASFVKKILELISSGEKNYVDIACAMYEDLGTVDKKAIEESIDFLVETNQLKVENRTDKQTGQTVQWWRRA